MVYQVAAQWLRTSMGLFISHKHKGNKKENKKVKAVVQSIFDAFPVDMESLKLHDTDKRFFMELDLEQPDMRKVRKNVLSHNWQGARQAYVEALAERFSSKHGWPASSSGTVVDIAEADDICRNIFILKAHMRRRYDFGEKVQWDTWTYSKISGYMLIG